MLFYFLGSFFFLPNLLGDPENYIKANPLVTPVHIMPEWYFLFAYTILRTIPNKLGGVLLLVGSIVILMILPFINKAECKGNSFKIFVQFFFWLFVANFILLTILGGKPVENPYLVLCLLATHLYFFWFFFTPFIEEIHSFMISN